MQHRPKTWPSCRWTTAEAVKRMRKVLGAYTHVYIYICTHIGSLKLGCVGLCCELTEEVIFTARGIDPHGIARADNLDLAETVATLSNIKPYQAISNNIKQKGTHKRNEKR